MLSNLNIREALPGLALVVIGLGCLVATFNIEILDHGGIGPRVFPMAAAVIVAGLGAVQVLSARSAPAEDEDAPEDGDFGWIAALLALSVVYVTVINYFGYIIGTAIAAPAVLYIFGIRSVPGLLIAAVLCPVIYHLIFFVGLGIFPPYGLWFDVLDLFER